MTLRDLNILHEFNILYIEDDTTLLRQIKDVLDDFMHHTYTATNSKEGIKILHEHKIDLIISDILLEDESGIDFLKELKKGEFNEIPTILITAHTDTKYLLEAIKLKVENYIVKPINIKELLNTIHDILLPVKQQKEVKKSENLLKIISLICDGKQIDVIRYIIQNLDENDELHSSYTEIISQIEISKPTLVKIFKKLSEKDILTQVSYKRYKFNQYALDNL